jgi:hypothetical protein
MSIEAIFKPTDWAIAKREIYDACGWSCSTPIADAEGKAYDACTFSLNGASVLYRKAKITPTKVGLFVTLWKRIGNGPTQPYNQKDGIDLVVISTREGDHLGQFIFPKSILTSKGFLTTESKDGKRGFRVYPPWCITTNTQAIATQKWQSAFFITILSGHQTDFEQAKKLMLS